MNELQKKQRDMERNAELKPYIVFIRDYNKMLEMDETTYQKQLSEIKIGAESQWAETRKEMRKEAMQQAPIMELAVSVNQLEVKKEKIAGVVKDFLAMPELTYRVPMPDKDMTISNPEEMKLSELNVKFATTELSRILEHTTKAKRIVDGFKEPILALEKEITAKADSIKAALKAKQQAYLAKVKEEQDTINGVVNLIRETLHKLDVAQKTRDALLNKCMTDLDLGIQEIAIKHAKVPKAQKAEVKELLEEIQMKKEATIQIAEPEFVKANVVQTRAIEEKYTDTIGDEKAYFRYCIENGLWESHLTIKPNLNMFKAWVKMSHTKIVNGQQITVENHSLPFVKRTLDLK